MRWTNLQTLTLTSYIWNRGCVENGAPSWSGTMALCSLIWLGCTSCSKVLSLFSWVTVCQFGSAGSGGGSEMATPVVLMRVFSEEDPSWTSLTIVWVMFWSWLDDRSSLLAVVLSSENKKYSSPLINKPSKLLCCVYRCKYSLCNNVVPKEALISKCIKLKEWWPIELGIYHWKVGYWFQFPLLWFYWLLSSYAHLLMKFPVLSW